MKYALTCYDDALQFSYEGEDLDQVVCKVKTLLAAAFPAPGILNEPETPAPETKKGRGRPRKDAAPASEPVQTDIEDVTGDDPDAPQPTYDDVVNSLKDVNSKHGWSAVRAIILPYGAQKISEVKPCDFVAVIAAAKEKAAA